MRMAFTAAIAFAAFATASAVAAPISIRPVSASPDFQEKIEDEYGARELEELSQTVEEALSRELEQAGAEIAQSASYAIEPTIEDAKPNRPTFKQLGDTPGLSMQSFGIGGAKLSARIVDMRTNEVVQTVTYAWYETDIRNAVGTATWSDARRAIWRFASNVAEIVAETGAAEEPAGS